MASDQPISTRAFRQLSSSGELLSLPFMHAGQPILAERGRWADPRVAGNTRVTQAVHVRAIPSDPRWHLMSSADGPVTRDEDIDVVGRALEQPQRGQVVLNRVRGAVQVQHRNQESECMSPATRTPRSSINSAA